MEGEDEEEEEPCSSIKLCVTTKVNGLRTNHTLGHE
jgi:hypothetical protein